MKNFIVLVIFLLLGLNQTSVFGQHMSGLFGAPLEEGGSPVIITTENSFRGARLSANSLAINNKKVSCKECNIAFPFNITVIGAPKAYVLTYEKTGIVDPIINGKLTIFSYDEYDRLKEVSYYPTRRTWHSIVPIYIGPLTFLLFYDQVNEEVEIGWIWYDDNGRGGIRISTKNTYSDWGKWDTVVPYTMGLSSFMLFYNQSTGKATSLKLKMNGSIDIKNEILKSTWNKGWDEIVFYVSGFETYMLRYNQEQGLADFHTMHISGKLGVFKKQYKNFLKTWTSITPFVDQLFTGILFHDSQSDYFKIYNITGANLKTKKSFKVNHIKVKKVATHNGF